MLKQVQHDRIEAKTGIATGTAWHLKVRKKCAIMILVEVAIEHKMGVKEKQKGRLSALNKF